MAIQEINDTICAISTPPGCGGIAVVRISGPEAIKIANSLWRGKSLETVPSHTAHFGTMLDSDESELDEGVATVFRAPRSFTGEDTVEISVHGSKWIQRQAVNALIDKGARSAGPGEFTRRAFASGRMDLVQVEAVADLIASSSRAAARVALSQMRGGVSSRLDKLREQLIELAALLELELDFSEEDVEFASRDKLIETTDNILAELRHLLSTFRSGAAIKEGIPVAIAGATNAGKSSLLNALLGEDRAIVSDIHGTTRDTIEDTIEIGDYLLRFIDTAGIRHTDDSIERLGIERSIRALKHARIILHVVDATAPQETNLDAAGEDAIVIRILNKCDAVSSVSGDGIKISALNGDGLDEVRKSLVQAAEAESKDLGEDAVLITNVRHAEALKAAATSAQALSDGLRTTLPADLLAQDLRETLHHLSTITGEITTNDILINIFENFCIGK